MTTAPARTRRRYLIDINPEAAAYHITDEVLRAPCGLPDAAGVSRVLTFERHQDAAAWLDMCADAGLPMRYALDAGTDILAAEQAPAHAAEVRPGDYVWDAARASWATVVGRSREGVHMWLFIDGQEDPLRYRFDDVVQVCRPMALRHRVRA